MKATTFTGLLLALAVSAGAVSPKLTSTSPAGGQRGRELEIRFNGLRLEDAQEVIFYSPGLEVVKLDTSKTNNIRAMVRIAPDCRLGEHPLRLRTATGVSDLRTFYVSPYPNLIVGKTNNTLEKAMTIPLNVTVNGSCGGEQVDWFRVVLKKGDRLSAEVEAIRLGRAMLDTRLAVLDRTGKEIASSDDTALLLQDSLITLLAPADGIFYVQIRDASYGGSESAYRLHIGNFPRPTAVYPAGGKAGEMLKVKFIGDATGEFMQEIKLPDAPQEKFGAFVEQNGLFAPSPNRMRVSSFPNVLASGQNTDKDHATSAYAELPIALNGIIAKDGDAAWFKFLAKKGEPLDVNVYARRLRSPLDSVLEIFDAKGVSVAANDDGAGVDSVVKFAPAADGEYLLKISDQIHQGGPDYVYRVEITPQEPAVAVSIPQVARNNSQDRQYITVPRGNRFATMMLAKRANFTGDLVFSGDGLPRGVTLQADTLPAKVDLEPLVFEAAADAPIGGKMLDFYASSADPSKKVRGSFRQRADYIDAPGQTFYYSTEVGKLYVAVTEAAPFKISIVEPKVPLVQFGVMDLQVTAERKPGFDEPITVKMMWNPPGVGSQPDITIPKGAKSAIYQLNASGLSEARKWKIAVLGSATVQGGPLFVSSQLAAIEIAEPFVVGKIEPASTEPGQPVKVVCKLEQKKPFEGKATVKLLGLPDHVTAPDLQISSADQEVVFNVTVEPQAAPGSSKTLFCSVDIKTSSQIIPHNLGSGGILRITAPKKGTGPKTVASKAEPKVKK